MQFSITKSALYASARGLYEDTNPLANVTIMGVLASVSNVTLNGAALTSGWIYNASTRVLEVRDLKNSTSRGAWASDWVLRWT
jgi:alpha-glucosidase